MSSLASPSYLFPGHASRAATFENPTGAVSAGGAAAGGRKGAPSRIIAAGERVVLADFDGPGTITHIWLTVASARLTAPPGFLRAQILEVFYDGASEPSMSVPVPDLFGAVHGVTSSYASALTAVNDGRGFTLRIPMPFRRHIRIEYENGSDELAILYYQADALLGPIPDDTGILHVAFRRENPTIEGRDFVIDEGLRGPGRYLGCTGGVRVLDDRHWWGEGEVKVFLDGEPTPTICGTGTEDYLDSAWGLGAFASPESGAPLVRVRPGAREPRSEHQLIGFYRWHLSDPIVFSRALRVTVQQIGSAFFRAGEDAEYAAFRASVTVAGRGWIDRGLSPPALAIGLYERADDWCAASFVYCADAQPVPRVDRRLAGADLPSA
jgi:hypothetical protein